MSQATPSYLQTCHQAFRAVSELKYKYGVPFDLPAIERAVAHLRRTTPLTYQDLRYFEAEEHWWFQKFWVFPPERHVTAALEGATFDFWNLPRNEDTVIPQLLDAFKSIELVSIILRFIRPEHNGIISPPVERILDVRRGSDAAETYRNYLSDLRAIRDRASYGFMRAADADMALWVLHERCFGTHRDPEIERAYRTDPFILSLRAKNLVAPLAELSRPRLAAALRGTAPDLAALLACHTLELQIRKIAERLGAATVGTRIDLSELIDGLPNYSGIDQLRKGNWRRLNGIRNGLFHEGRQPTPRETQDLVSAVLDTEELLETLRAIPR